MNNIQHLANPQCGRRKRLATVVALALIGAGTAMAAEADQHSADNVGMTSDVIVGLIAQANSPAGLTDAQVAATIAAHSYQPHATQANTVVVQNCDNDGFGSLRAAVAGAASGDIIDMSALGCDTINLDSAIIVDDSSLTLKGRWGFFVCGLDPIRICYYSVPTLTGQDSHRVIDHQGTGTLVLDSITVSHGNTSTPGGCINSQGDVSLRLAFVRDCTAARQGGGIHAADDVILTDSHVIDNLVTGSEDYRTRGGGIYAGDIVTLVESKISGNVAKGSLVVGGGIFAAGGVLVTDNSAIVENEARAISDFVSIGGAGGVSAGGPSMVSESEISDNSAHGDFGSGGGIFVDGSLYMNSSIVEGNNTDNEAGGIYLRSNSMSTISSSTIINNSANGTGALRSSGPLTIDHSTIANNVQNNFASVILTNGVIVISQSTISGNETLQDSTHGAGFYVYQADVTIKNSTITNNTGHNSSNQPHGAGISLGDAASLTLSSTIVSGNQLGTSAVDIGLASGATSALISGGHNLIGWIDPAIPYPGDTIFNANPQLGPLADNGGLTLTHMPQLNSDAIGMGFANSYTDDQRGTGFLRTINGYTDIGSVQHDGDTIFFNGFE